MASTRNGWTASPVIRMTISAPGCIDTGQVRAGDVARVFQHFTAAFDAQVEPLTTINGYRTSAYNTSVGGAPSSNHLSGTALDFNGARHPYERNLPASQRGANYRHGFWDVQIVIIRALLTRYEGVIAWGLDFNIGYRDAMHFEIRGTAGDVARVAAKLTSKTLTEEEDTMITIARLKPQYGDPRVWRGDGIIRTHVPNTNALTDLQAMIRAGVLKGDETIHEVDSVAWLGMDLTPVTPTATVDVPALAAAIAKALPATGAGLSAAQITAAAKTGAEAAIAGLTLRVV